MMNTLHSHFDRLRRDRSGNFGIMTAILLPVLIGAAGVAIDYSNNVMSQRQLQEATDSAALAVATALANGKAATSADGEKLAKDFVIGQMANYVDSDILADIEKTISVEIDTTTTSEGKSYKIAVNCNYPLATSPLMGVLGYKTMNVAAESKTASGITQEKSALSMTLVLDQSGSMLANTGTEDKTQTSCVQYDDSGKAKTDKKGNVVQISPCYIKKIDALKDAANLLLDQLDKADPSKPAKYVRTNAIGWSDKVRISSTFDWGTSRTRTNVINKLSAGNGTESAAPMQKAYDGLSGTNSTSETGIQKAAGNSKLTKYIVFMTDGNNNATTSDTNTRTTCTAAKDNGIKIYSIAFMAPDRGQKLLQDCSSGTGYYYKAESLNDLLGAFQAIGQQATASKTLLTN
ncbi:TadE/TadG family type IV pilus assembly protein [Rhizobium sp. KDH_Rht_773_N]